MKPIKKLFLAVIGMSALGFLTLIFLFVTYHFWPEMYHSKINHIFISSVSGTSMEPTLIDNQSLRIDSSISPRIGDIVSFECFTEKCANGHPKYDSGRVKRLADIRDNCYYFLGDNARFSWDSRNYGWLCGSDIRIDGVVIK